MATANATVKKVLDHLLQNGGGNTKVIKEWHSGSSWYRQWQSGFIEQGGVYTQDSSAGALQKEITFPIPFTSLPSLAFAPLSTTGSNVEITASNLTNTGVELCYGDGGSMGTCGFSWVVCGY